MASARVFDSLPPFPTDVAVADIPKVSLAKLAQDDESEAKVMFDACCTLGFYLLDLTEDVVGRKMIEEIDAIFEVMQKTMCLSTEEKERYKIDIPRDFMG